MNITSTRRADEFNRLLESDARTDDPVAGPMLAVAEALRAVPTADGPRPEFRTALRQRLLAVATVQGVGATDKPLERVRAAGSTWKVQRRLTALAAGAAVVTGVTGVALGASRSLPGQPFYGVKRATEGAQLASTVGTEARGKRHLEFARTRLREIKALSGTSSSSLGPISGGHLIAAAADSAEHTKLILDTLHDMDVETRAGANDLFAAFRDSGSTEPLRALNNFSQRQYSQLQGLVGELPLDAQPSARSSLALLAVIATDTVHSATGGSPSTRPSSPAPGPTSTAHPGPSSHSTPPGSQPSSASTGSSAPSKGGSSTPPPVPAPHFSPPSLPTIPPLPVSSTLPTSLPSLPDDLSGLLGH